MLVADAVVDVLEVREGGWRMRTGGGGGGLEVLGGRGDGESAADCDGARAGSAGLGAGRWGSLGGSEEGRRGSQSMIGEETEVAERCSKDSARLAVSKSRGSGRVAREGDEGERSFPPSEESETEWKEEIDDAGACPERVGARPMVRPRVGVRVAGDDTGCSARGGRAGGGLMGLRGTEEDVVVDREAVEIDLREVYDGLRGGSGGTPDGLAEGGDDSRLMSGADGRDAMAMGPAVPRCAGLVPWGGEAGGSTTQSLRSIKEVLRPRMGGEGEGEGTAGAGRGRRGGEDGAMGEKATARRGPSRMFCGERGGSGWLEL